jgi:hypothetical protein
MHSIIHWLENHLLPCFYEQCFGIPCPGCGMQRAIVALLKGNIIESLRLYPALIPVLLMVSFLLIHLVFRFRQGGIVLKWMFILNAVIIFFNYLYKLILINH